MLRFYSSGESHGPVMIAFLEGVPAGFWVNFEAINGELKRRQGGYGRGGRMRIESDQVEILSGLRNGATVGSPLTLAVHNRDNRINSAPKVVNLRPGHGDLAGCLKYGTRDARGILERASARDTVTRTAAGALCRQLLEHFGVRFLGFPTRIGSVELPTAATLGVENELSGENCDNLQALREGNDFYALSDDSGLLSALTTEVDRAKDAGDTLGGTIEIVVDGLLPGLGSHTQWDRKLDGRISQMLMSVQAIKSVEFGIGAASASIRGSQVHDPALPPESGGHTYIHRVSNNAGGLEAGITNGMPLIVRATMKPISTLMSPLDTVNIETLKAAKASTERSDVCAVPAASVVLENAVAIPLLAAFLEKFGGDSMKELERNVEGYRKQLREILTKEDARGE